jgi:serine/threonine protein kinase
MKTLIGTTLRDRYFLRELKGSGGMADVYLAWDNLRASKMAIKILRRDLANNTRFFRMFAKEAELLRKLEHPNIVRLYEYNKEGDLAFIVMDWIEGSNVRQTLNERKKPFSLEEVSVVLQPVCSALNYAHQNKVYHCDIKPANILLHIDGRVLLTDFGVARLASDRIRGGTPPYMAPELFSRGAVNAKTDIYSLGITLYEIFSGGQVPFRGDNPSSQGSTTRDRLAWELTNLPLPPLKKYNPSLPDAVESVVSTALSKNPAQRYSSAMELRQAYEESRKNVGVEPGGPKTIIDLISPLVDQIPSSMKSKKPSPRAKTPPKRVKKPEATPKPGLFPKPVGQMRGPNLFVRSGEWPGQAFGIPRNGIIIGRGSQAQLRLQDASVSRKHATIIRTRRGIYIRDERSSLGTFVNNQRIPSDTPVQLRSGDVIRIGYYQFFEFRDK